MTNRLRLSKNASNHLEHLSHKLGLRRNIVCRIAVAKSLTMDDKLGLFYEPDNSGYEFNRTTLTGNHDVLYKALICQYEGWKIPDDEFFSVYFRHHIERGVDVLYRDYSKVNSPIEFLVKLVDEGK